MHQQNRSPGIQAQRQYGPIQQPDERMKPFVVIALLRMSFPLRPDLKHPHPTNASKSVSSPPLKLEFRQSRSEEDQKRTLHTGSQAHSESLAFWGQRPSSLGGYPSSESTVRGLYIQR